MYSHFLVKTRMNRNRNSTLRASWKQRLHRSPRRQTLALVIISLQMPVKAHTILQRLLQLRHEDHSAKGGNTTDTTRIRQESRYTRAALFTALETSQQRKAKATATMKVPTTIAAHKIRLNQLSTGVTLPIHILMHLSLRPITCFKALSRTTTFPMQASCLRMLRPLYPSMTRGCIQARRQQTSVRRRARLRDGHLQPLFHRRWP